MLFELEWALIAVSFVVWARFLAHVLADCFAWAKKGTHPSVTAKEVAFYLRSFADKFLLVC